MFLRVCIFFMLIWTVTLTSGCTSGAGKLPPLGSTSGNEYRLAVGDEVRILVPGLAGMEAGSSSTYIVNDRGLISIPIVGSLEGVGKSVPELEEAIARKLVASEILVSPKVSIQPVRMRPFYILGEVNKPGEYPYRPGLSVLSAISVAGGYTFRADQKAVAVTRLVNGQLVTGRADENAFVQPGDTIRVHERWF